MQSSFDVFINALDAFFWQDTVLIIVLVVGLLFTVWSKFSQIAALTHGTAVIRGLYDKKGAPGAINHFQALSAALSATVGLGNIGGVALAISLGGPGAVFWMWVTGVIGMALKLTEVTQAMLHRDLSDPNNPSGGAMWVAKRGFEKISPALKPLGVIVGGVFCITLLISTITGGNMFQAWSVAYLMRDYFEVPTWITGIIQMVLVGLVILGGIKRIGAVAGRLVPFMCLLYLGAALVVVTLRVGEIPGVFALIFDYAFSPGKAEGAFVGGAMASAFLLGMKRSLFSNEAGQGSSPIAHAAAKTDEPVREGVVAGLEPFIDTLVVCTITALVILLSGLWRREPEWKFETTPTFVAAEEPGTYVPNLRELPASASEVFRDGDSIALVAHADFDERRQNNHTKVEGVVVREKNTGTLVAEWSPLSAEKLPSVTSSGLFNNYAGATLTAKAFDSVLDGLGKWIVPLVAWLFAISTMISWSYYGEQGSVYLFGKRSVFPYRIIYCACILIASTPLIGGSEGRIEVVSSLGTGVMLFANIPIMLIFGPAAMRAYHDYMRRFKAGAFPRGEAPSLRDVAEGKNV